MLTAKIKTRVQVLKEDFYAELDQTIEHDSWQSKTHRYRRNPSAFAKEILGSTWWSQQEEIANLLVHNRRVAVKSANGVGKTYLAADLALWFLYTHRPSIVVTTAPISTQMRHLLWEELRKRHDSANSRPSSSYSRDSRQSSVVGGRAFFHSSTLPLFHSRRRLPGKLLTTRLAVANGWYAMGVTSDKADQFQGFHCKNLLIILDEASGIPESIWEACEGIAVGENNKILALGNPLTTEGQFYRCFARPGGNSPLRGRGGGWATHTISAIDHPNIIEEREVIPGCVTIPHLEDRIAEWCEKIESEPSAIVRRLRRTKPGRSILSRRAGNRNRNRLPTPDSRPPSPTPDVFEWDGIQYRPNNLFRARVLGEFPDGNDESLIPLRWIEAAVQKWERNLLPEVGCKRMAVDVARFGDDDTVIGYRIGPVLHHMEVIHGADTMAVAGRINQLAYKYHPETIAIDSIGIGAGVVDRLRELGTEGIFALNVSRAAYDAERFANRRAELYWGLREKFHEGTISIRNDSRLIEELAAIRYKITSQGLIQMERKHEMKRRLRTSPDRADMLALLYDGPVEVDTTPVYREPSPAELLRREMQIW